jgi:transcriptional regulator with XRE-family HTH domain
VDAKVGKRILAARIKAELTQRQLSEHTGGELTAAYISRIEAGERLPSIDALRMIADALNIDRETLRTGRTDGVGDPRLAGLQRRIKELEQKLKNARKALGD